MESAHGAPIGAAQGLLEPAWQMRWRVPELALMLSDRAVAQARLTGDRSLRLRAEALALFASNRLGQGVLATQRAIAAVRDAEAAADTELAAQLRVELACCARGANSNEVALRVLSPVLAQERVDPVVRADALLELATALPACRKESEGVSALDEADRLYLSSNVDRDTGKLLRARVSVARAAHFRRSGDFSSAVEAVDGGLALLGGLTDQEADGGELNAHLLLERVHALLDLGQRSDAVKAAGPIVNQPVRAVTALPSGWLRLALATRVHLPEGEHGVAVWLLNDAAAVAERHGLDALLAEALGSTSHAHERAQDFPAALKCLRGAYAADRRWRTAVHGARLRLLEEFPSASSGAAVSRPQWLPAEAPAATPAEEPVAAPAGESVEVPVEASEDGEPERRRGGRRRAEDTDRIDATRRLMETLRRRSAERAGGEPEAVPTGGRRAMPEPRVGDFDYPGPSADSGPSAYSGPSAHSGSSAEPAGSESTSPSAEDFPAFTFPSEEHSYPQADESAELAAAGEPEPAEPEAAGVSWPSGTAVQEAVPEPAPAAPEAGADARVDPLGGWPPWDRSPAEDERKDVPAPREEAPDVTTIMPVIAVPPQPEPEPEPARGPEPASSSWPEAVPSAAEPAPVGESSPFGSYRRAESLEPVRHASPEPEAPEPEAAGGHGSERYPAAARGELDYEPAAYESASYEPERHSAPAHGRPEPEPSVAEPEERFRPAAESDEGGRRSKGKSLAEIRASLRLVQDSARRRPAEQAVPEQSGRRRARHADPDDDQEAAAGGEPAGALLARYGQWAPERPAAPEPERELPEEVGLADLLAEALMAYENGRRDQGGSGRADITERGGRRHASSLLSETDGGPRAEHQNSSTSDEGIPPARHRRAAMDSSTFDSRSWTPYGR